jgi:hypothetical protein
MKSPDILLDVGAFLFAELNSYSMGKTVEKIIART